MPQLQPELTFRALSLLLIIFLGPVLVVPVVDLNVEGEPVWLAT
jgi:hypothetical protein